MSSNQTPKNDPGQKSPGKSPQTPPPNRMGRGLLSWVIVIGILIVFFALMNASPTGDQVDSWGKFKNLVDPET
ncbi:MAG: hypothetical protein P8J89_03685, partial [Phycisphaerales bacterium]|nr:hypothetical protein [Phycisphaerales bacterium]